MKLAWSSEQLKELRADYDKKPAWMTDYRLAGQLASRYGKSPESIRWQLREFHRDVVQQTPAKILLVDIETLPIEALVWDVWKQNIYMEQIEKDWSVLCWAAKWLFDTKVMGQVVTPEEAMAHEDASVLPKIWELMNEADIIVWHNGENFDRKKLNSRFFLQGMPKPMYYKSVDTLKIATDNFSFTYNKLDWIAKIVGIGRKIETEFDWWKECHEGNKKYLDMMLKYNKWDVNLEEEVYLRLRPWMEQHPNMNLYGIGDVLRCRVCGSEELSWNGKYTTPLGLYQACRCEVCGAIGRSTLKQFKIKGSKVGG